MIKVSFNNVIASATNLQILTAGMVNGRSVKFEFSSEWDTLNKTAVFTNGIDTRIVPEYKWTEGNVVSIPPEVLTTPHRFVQCGVYGMNDSSEVIIPTLWVDLGRVFPSANPNEYEESVPPTPTTWDDLQNQIGVLSKLNTKEKSNLVKAINELFSKGLDSEEILKIIEEKYALEDNLTFDKVVTTDEEFSACLYALDGGSPDPMFKHKNILVKGVTFKIQRGSSDLDLHIFQPSIKYIKFENCRWETEWWVSGKVPTTISEAGTQYERAQGDFDLVIDGIEVSADNVQSAKDAGVYWYIGLRNIKALINSTVRYPEGYDIGNGWDFKLTCQYFDYASNNLVPALWDGTNVSDCYITEKLVRCKGCMNIASAPVIKDEVINPVAIQWCAGLSNFSGTFTYHGCTFIDYDTCEGSSTPNKPYDYIVRSMTELRDVLTKSLVGSRILLRDFDINTTDTLDFKWAGYVEFSNMRFYADIILANVWALDGAGLDAGNNKYSVTVEGSGRSRVSNFGRLPVSSTESKYIFKQCRSVNNCIIGGATECSAIHGCYISKNADVVISGCTDICGLTVIPSGRTATTTLSGCINVSHISNKGTGKIVYDNCTNVDFHTCDGYKVANNYWGASAIFSQNADGINRTMFVKPSVGGNFIPQRDGNGNIQLPKEQTDDNQALSLAYAKTIFIEMSKYEELSARIEALEQATKV